MDKSNQLKHITDQLIGKGNLNIVVPAFASGYTAHTGEKTYKGHQFIKRFTKQLRTAIPDIRIVKIEILSQTENVLTWQRVLSGTHKIDFKGIPASGKKLKWYEMIVSRFDKDKIVEEWLLSDLAFQLMLKQK